nr:MAG: hypothetical protein [Microviridae sp.]
MHPTYGMVTPPISCTIEYNDAIEGECIERRVEKIMNANEPITDGAPIIYTQRNEGVIPEYNVRTDRWDIALDMTHEVTRQALVKREEFHRAQETQNSTENPSNTPERGTPSGGNAA